MTGLGNGSAPAAGPRTVDKGADFANYFCTYAFLYHQKEMLSDRVRMEAYHSAVFRNAGCFVGKVVLDVGTGSGILAIWAAQAGAKKVYAVEATNMAQHAKKLATANSVGHIVEVIQGSMEEVELPEKVDIIISEWMGYFLVRESMLDSVLVARDRWLKPGGALYPSHARMWMAPIRSSQGEQKRAEFQSAMADWHGFCQQTTHTFGVDMNTLSDQYREEQKKYFLQTSLWNSLYPDQVIGAPAIVKEIDCLTCSIHDIESICATFTCPLTLSSSSATSQSVYGFGGWFDVAFRGSPSNPAEAEVQLTTAPSVDATTHWGQQVFLLHPPLQASEGDVLHASLDITRSKENHRLMNVKITHNLARTNGQAKSPLVTSQFYIE